MHLKAKKFFHFNNYFPFWKFNRLNYSNVWTGFKLLLFKLKIILWFVLRREKNRVHGAILFCKTRGFFCFCPLKYAGNFSITRTIAIKKTRNEFFTQLTILTTSCGWLVIFGAPYMGEHLGSILQYKMISNECGFLRTNAEPMPRLGDEGSIGALVAVIIFPSLPLIYKATCTTIRLLLMKWPILTENFDKSVTLKGGKTNLIFSWYLFILFISIFTLFPWKQFY